MKKRKIRKFESKSGLAPSTDVTLFCLRVAVEALSVLATRVGGRTLAHSYVSVVADWTQVAVVAANVWRMSLFAALTVESCVAMFTCVHLVGCLIYLPVAKHEAVQFTDMRVNIFLQQKPAARETCLDLSALVPKATVRVDSYSTHTRHASDVPETLQIFNALDVADAVLDSQEQCNGGPGQIPF